MADLSSVLEKIRKLRALATSTNVHEASAAAAMADRLMQEYRIAEAQLESANATVEEPAIGDPNPLISWNRNITNWQNWLGDGLCKHYGCRGLTSTRSGMRVFLIYGRPQDIATVRYMYAWLTSEIVRLVNLNGTGQGKAWRDSYCKGAVVGILEAMKAEEQKARAQATSQAHAIIDKRGPLSKAAMMRDYPSLRTRQSTGASTGDAFYRGKSDSSAISNKNKIGGPATTKLLK